MDDGADFDKTFIEQPDILDKYKAAAEVCDSKLLNAFVEKGIIVFHKRTKVCEACIWRVISPL